MQQGRSNTWLSFRSAQPSKVAQFSVGGNNRDNIDDDELDAFWLLAKSYAGLAEQQVAQLVSEKHFVEICRDDKA